jgi:hypothetical protein
MAGGAGEAPTALGVADLGTIMNPFYDLVPQDYNDVFAEATNRSEYEEGPPCPGCKFRIRKRLPPYRIELDTDYSNVIADFTWPQTLEVIVVSERVRACFESERFAGCAFEPVEIVPRKKRRRNARQGSAQDLHPFGGFRLWHMRVTSTCKMDLAASGRSMVPDCPVCDRAHMIVHDYAARLVIRPESWRSTDLFTIEESGGLMFGAGRVKRVIQEHKFTNVEMKEAGTLPTS